MYSQTNLFLIALLFISFTIWQVWQTDNLKNSHESHIIHNQHNIENGFFEPPVKNKKIITVKTDVLEVKINALGGNIEEVKLLTYANKLDSKEPLKLLKTSSAFVYQAQSGFISANDLNNEYHHIHPFYTAVNSNFQLSPGKNKLYVPLTWIDKDGIVYTKTFEFKRGEFAINVNHKIDNRSKHPIQISIFGQLKQTITLPHSNNYIKNLALNAFRGAVYSTSDKKYKKYKFNNIVKNQNLNLITNKGWIGMQQQYFTTAWIPHTLYKNIFYTSNLGNGIVAIGYTSSPILIREKAKKNIRATLWVGPSIQEKMSKVAPYLNLTVDYGWLWFLSQPLFKLLKILHKFIGNWGFAIILITFIVRVIMYPLTKAQYISMAKMRILNPKIKLIRERYGDDKQKMSQEMMALYKTEKVNPLGGCLPVLIQMPIFLALYYMLSASIELRHAPFILWIHDLSAQDPYYILPMIMGLTMFVLQKTSPKTTNDPVQLKIMTYMPIMFSIFFLWFPSGLVLYYIVSNIFTILQQQLIYRSLKQHGLYTE